MYVIQWKSKVNGRAGKGTKVFEYGQGRRLVEELNLEYPQIQHELSESGPPPEAAPAELHTDQESEESTAPDRSPVPVH